MKAYINGIGSVAPQPTMDRESFLDEVFQYDSNRLQIVDLNYRDYLDPRALRRMSKIVRMSLVAAKVALKDAQIEKPDAILTGTGMGCQVDTEKFLNAMLKNKETLLNPTAFIQSTHNTMGAQIALLDNNNSYNLTFVHRTFSFESALLDSLMLLNEDEATQILLGGIDEITEESWLIKTRIGHYKKLPLNNMQLLGDKQPGALAGESAAFFVLSKAKSKTTYAEIVDSATFFRPENEKETENKINDFLTKNNLNPDSVGLILFGFNGDPKYDKNYLSLEKSLFANTSSGYYKHLCGEHDTSSAYAMWLAAEILKSGRVPEVLVKSNRGSTPPETALIYNHFRNVNHSLILLRKTD